MATASSRGGYPSEGVMSGLKRVASIYDALDVGRRFALAATALHIGQQSAIALRPWSDRYGGSILHDRNVVTITAWMMTSRLGRTFRANEDCYRIAMI